MGKKITISESEKLDILKMYGIIYEDLKRPLQKLRECKITADGKYIVFEGNAYVCETGEQVPLNEEWTLSDVLHTGADLLSVGMDFVIPGSGAIIDILNAVSYVIEAQFKNDEEKDSLYLMAAITFAFVILPGPLQAISVPLKRAVKTGVGLTSKVVVEGLKIIGKSLNILLFNLPNYVSTALKSPLAKNILGKFGNKISGYIDNFISRIKSIMSKITGETTQKTGKEGLETIAKQVSDIDFVKTNLFDLPKGVGKDAPGLIRSYYSDNAMKLLSPKISGLPKIFDPSKVKILKKSNVAGREIIEVSIENGQTIIFYKVTGKGGKVVPPPGAWSVIPGFAPTGAPPNCWFIKNYDTIALTHTSAKGGGVNKYLTEMSQFLEKNGTDGLGKKIKTQTNQVLSSVKQLDVNPKLISMSNEPISKELLTTVKSKYKQLSLIAKPELGTNGKKILNKIGFKGNIFTKKYRAKIANDEYIDYVEVIENVANAKPIRMGVWDFLKKKIIEPGTVLNTTALPLVIKSIVRIFNSDGTINQEELSALPDISTDQLQKELDYLNQVVAQYEGDTRKYTVNNNVILFQQALVKLGYPLPKFGVDGKFGPETQGALRKFQEDNKIQQTSIGKMDRFTAKELSKQLKTKNITDSQELQTSLDKI